ncbi:MAG: glycosyltransferase [Planctomycetota bacterium]
MKILVFCSDALPYPGLATSGGGIRCWQLIESLSELGHQVIPSMPLFTKLARQFADRIPPEIKANAWTPENQDSLVARHRPDAILFTSTWIVDQLTHTPDCLQLYDLSGPQMLEMHYKGEANLARQCQAKIERLAKADFVFCAGQYQRHYFFPYLMLAGFSPEELERFAVVPLALSPRLPVTEPPDHLELISAGGFYPWQDPSIGLKAVFDVLKSSRGSGARLRIFGTSHGVTGDDDRAYESLRDQAAGCREIEFHDFVPREELVEIERKCSFAIELHARNPERELAFTSRTVHHLWCGLPVLYNNFGELAGWIREYDAGWTVDPEDSAAVADCLLRILERPQELEFKRTNVRRLVLDRLIYSAAIGPLADFLSEPTRVERRMPARVSSSTESALLKRLQNELEDMRRSRAFRAAQAVSRVRGAWRRRVGGGES